jgi:acyl-coenzyme A thioesterase PaaI-like protein
MFMSQDEPLLIPPAPAAPPESADADAPDPSVVMAERQLRMLQEIAETGMAMIRILKERAEIDLQTANKLTARADLDDGCVHGPNYPAPMNDASAMFVQVSRAVRLTLALEAKTDERLRALRAGLVVQREARRAEAVKRAAAAGEARHEAARNKVHLLVIRAIEAEARDDEDENDLYEALDERLDEDEAYDKLEDLPLREVVEQLCADLGIEPDWDRWEGDGWKADPFPCRSKLSQFRTPSRKKILPDRPPGPWGFNPQACGP